jgi:hypothetical protein
MLLVAHCTEDPKSKGCGMVRKILLICGIVSSVLYIVNDLIGTLLYEGYSYADQEFSELTAQGSAVRPLMIALTEIPYTLLVVAFAAGVWESAGRRRAAGPITAVMLIGYALTGMVTGVFFPMATREDMAAGEGTLRNAMHPPGTIVMSLFIVLAMAFGATLLGESGSDITRMGPSSRSSCLAF